MRTRFIIGTVLTCALTLVTVSASAAPLPFPAGEERSSELIASITGPTDIGVGRTIVLTASASRFSGEGVRYEWYVGNREIPIGRGIDVLFTPEDPGRIVFRLVIRATIDGEERTTQAEHTVVAYTHKILLLADATVPTDTLTALQSVAASSGVFLHVLQPATDSAPLEREDALARVLAEQPSALDGVERIVVWTDEILGLQSLVRAARDNEDIRNGLRGRTIMLLTDRSLPTLARTTQVALAVLAPDRILLTRPAAAPDILAIPGLEELRVRLIAHGVETMLVDPTMPGVPPWQMLSVLVRAMLAEGVPTQIVLLLLVLPVIATILAALKQVVGLKTFGLYTPSIVALSFLSLGATVGIVFLLVILATGYAVRAAMRKIRLLYIPKVAVIITIISLALLLLLAIGTAMGMRFSRETVFVLLIMSTLTESFLNLKTEAGWISAITGVGETLVASLICTLLVRWPAFQSLFLAYPEIVLLAIVVNFGLGRWTGLRVVEYFRFREVFRHLQEEE
jgi:hypothetical protein